MRQPDLGPKEDVNLHMGNELLTLPVAGTFIAAAGAGVGYASFKARKELDERRVPLLGVLGAFVFAAQMVKFPILILPGVTGHFVGGALLAIVLGPHAAVLGMAAIVIVQCIVFQDGDSWRSVRTSSTWPSWDRTSATPSSGGSFRKTPSRARPGSTGRLSSRRWPW